MEKRHLERLLDKACEIITSLEHAATGDLKKEIDALFNEINYSDYLDSEMKDPGPEYDSAGFTEEDRIVEGQYRVVIDPDQEAQDWDTFGENKI